MPDSFIKLAEIVSTYQMSLAETKEHNKSFLAHPSNPIPRHYISNDHGIDELLDELDKHAPLKNPEKVNLALIAGEAHFLSCLPEFQRHVDAIILVDIQADILIHNQFMLDVFLNSNSPEEFIKKLTDAAINPVLLKYAPGKHSNNAALVAYSILHMIEQDRANNGSKHFLHSLARYQTCKKALANVKIFMMPFDLLLPTQAEQFKIALSRIEHQFNIVNVTNIPDYDTVGFPMRNTGNYLKTKSVAEQTTFEDRGNTAKVIQILTGNGNCLIWYSHLSYARTTLKLAMCQSVTEYQKQREEYLFKFAAHFYPASFMLNPKPKIVAKQSAELWSEPKVKYILEHVRTCWDNKNSNSIFSSLQLIKCNDGEIKIVVTMRSPKVFAGLGLFANLRVENNLKRVQSLLFNQQIPLYFLSQINDYCLQFHCYAATKDCGKTFLELLNSIQQLPKEIFDAYDNPISSAVPAACSASGR